MNGAAADTTRFCTSSVIRVATVSSQDNPYSEKYAKCLSGQLVADKRNAFDRVYISLQARGCMITWFDLV
jgi:hypothetical protein